MHFDQGGEADALGRVVEVAEPGIIESRHDQQHGVGARGARLPELVVVEDEVFPEERHVHFRAHRDEVAESASKVFLVGEHGHHRRAGLRVDTRLCRWIEGALSVPREGEAFLTSAMRRTPPGDEALSADSNSRAGPSPRQEASSPACGCVPRSRRSSSRLFARISSSAPIP